MGQRWEGMATPLPFGVAQHRGAPISALASGLAEVASVFFNTL